MAAKTKRNRTFFLNLFFPDKETRDEMNRFLMEKFEKGLLKPWYVTAESGALINHIAIVPLRGLALCGRAGTWSSARDGAFTKAICPVCMARFAAPLRTYLRARALDPEVRTKAVQDGGDRMENIDKILEATKMRSNQEFVDMVAGL